MDATSLMIAMGMNKGSGGGTSSANVGVGEDMLTGLFNNVASGAATNSTLLGGVPFIGEMLSTNAFKPFEPPEGLHEKMINPFASSFNVKGGFLAQLAAVFMKDGSITSQVEGIEPLEAVGAADYGDSGGGGGGGDTGSGFGETSMADSSMGGGGAAVEPLMVEYGGRKYEAESISESVLGGVAPSYGDAGGGKGGIEIG